MKANRFAPRTAACRTGVALFLGILCCAGGSRVHAGQLDNALLRKGGRVLHYLNDKGVQNVGVLPFQVKKGTRVAGYEDAPVALNITTRLENALIVSQDPTGKTIGIIRKALGSANRSKVGPYQTTRAAFDKLFAQDYQLAWGEKKVKATAFLTGTIVNSGKDRSRTSVVIEVFDANSWKAGKLVKQKVCEFDLPTDRSLLADLGYGWALSPTVLRRGYSAKDRDQFAVRQVARRDETEDNALQPGQSKAHAPDNVAGFSFEIFYNKVKQEIKPLSQDRQGQRLPLYQVPGAPAGAEIEMVLTRNDDSDRTLGVVVKVNGLSTFQKEDKESLHCRKWLYEASSQGKPDVYQGFYMDLKGKKLFEFRSLTAEESEARASELGNRVGWIDVEVFASKAAAVVAAAAVEPDEAVMQISTRSVGPALRGGKGLKDVQAALRKANNIRLKPVVLPFEPDRVRSRGVIDAAVEPIEVPEIVKGALPNPEALGSIAIRYWERGQRE